MTLAERQDAMRVKFRARRLQKMSLNLVKARAAQGKIAPPAAKVRAPRQRRVIVIRACIVPGDISTAKLDRMELLAYRIARRKWQIA